MKFEFPVNWPIDHRQRIPAINRKQGRFTCDRRPLTANKALSRLQQSADTWRGRVTDLVITANYSHIRQDGLPYSGQRSPDDPAVAVYFQLDGEPMVLPCDTYTDPAQNIAAIARALEHYRTLDRDGLSLTQGDIIIRLQLPEKTSADDWWDVLGVTASAEPPEIRRAYLRLLKKHHPDHTKDFDWAQWDKIQSAYELAGKP